MVQRLALLTITLFWVMMNVLLWRSEFAGKNHAGGLVPLTVVWRKILTAPDSSSLEITRHGEKIGYCRWSPAEGRTGAGKWLTFDAPAPGGDEAASDYKIDVEGNLLLTGAANQLRFDLSVRFDTNQVWQEFHLRLNLRPGRWEVHSLAADRTVRLRVEDDEGASEHVITFATLADPEALAREFDVAAPLGALGALGLQPHAPAGGAFVPGLKWEAREDRISIGHTPVRAYRLEARLLGHYDVVVVLSRVGEILRVELPGDLVLMNDQLDL
jgi:hypothetical protein